MTQLRFAPIIRVSTESQADDIKESLRDQTTQIHRYVKQLDGVIYREYKGQESAMRGSDRQIFQQLLQDAEAGLFDAVIVTDVDRFSRDNGLADQCIERWKVLKIRFFECTEEINLFDENQEYYLTDSVAQGKRQVKKMARKSMNARIHKAERCGAPTCGSQPFGRVWDKRTERWSILIDKKELVKAAAKRYLEGESVPDIARSYGISQSHLYRTLYLNSGTRWIQQFDSKMLNIHVEVPTTVPRLLDDEIIKKIHERRELNKTFHGEQQNDYLLTKFLRCAHCGYSLNGNPIKTKTGYNFYYSHGSRDRKISGCLQHQNVPTKELETAVLVHLFETFGDIRKIEEAVDRSIPDPDEKAVLTAEKVQMGKDLIKVKDSVQRLVKAVISGSLKEEDVIRERRNLEEREETVENRISQIDELLAKQPDPKQVKKLSKLAKAVFSDVRRQPGALLRKDYKLKRKFIEHCFSGKDAEGNANGVYIRWTKTKQYQVEIRGMLESTVLAWYDVMELSERFDPDKFVPGPEDFATKDDYVSY